MMLGPHLNTALIPGSVAPQTPTLEKPWIFYEIFVFFLKVLLKTAENKVKERWPGHESGRPQESTTKVTNSVNKSTTTNIKRVYNPTV